MIGHDLLLIIIFFTLQAGNIHTHLLLRSKYWVIEIIALFKVLTGLTFLMRFTYLFKVYADSLD